MNMRRRAGILLCQLQQQAHSQSSQQAPTSGWLATIRQRLFSSTGASGNTGDTVIRAPSRLNTWKGPAGQPPPVPPPHVMGTGAAAAASNTAAESTGLLTWFGSHQVALNSIPSMPKFLGFAGAIPFVTLTPYVIEAIGLHGLVDTCAKAQVSYGCLIVTFLGAIHWSLAMTSPAGSRQALAMINQRYCWSVMPSLAAWPALFMETGPASVAVAILLGMCYLADRSYARMGSLPSWYMALRGYLTTLAFTATLATTAYYVAKDVRKAKALMEADEARERAEAEEAMRLAQQAAAAVAAAAPPAKKGWFK